MTPVITSTKSNIASIQFISVSLHSLSGHSGSVAIGLLKCASTSQTATSTTTTSQSIPAQCSDYIRFVTASLIQLMEAK